MTFSDTLFTFLFGVGLPSWDVYSDLIFALKLVFDGHTNFALAMLMPVLLAMLFILPHWWNNEKKTTSCNKIFTFALVLLQFYPQWKMLNVLYMGLWKKNAKWKEEKERFQKNIGSLGKFLKRFLYLHFMKLLGIVCFRAYLGGCPTTSYHALSLGTESKVDNRTF